MKKFIALVTLLMCSFACSDFTAIDEQMDLVDSEESTLELEEDLDDPFARKAQTSTSQNFALKFLGNNPFSFALTSNGKWSVDDEAAEVQVRKDFTVVPNSTRDRDLLDGQIKDNQVRVKVKEYTDADYCACYEEPETCKYWSLDISDPNNTTVRLNLELAGMSALVGRNFSKFSLDLSNLDELGEKIPRVEAFEYSINGGHFIALENQALIWDGNGIDCEGIENWIYDNTSEPTNPGSAAYDLIKGEQGRTLSQILLDDSFAGNDDVCNHVELYKGQIALDLLDLTEGDNVITIRAIVKGNDQSFDAVAEFTKNIRITGTTPNCN